MFKLRSSSLRDYGFSGIKPGALRFDCVHPLVMFSPSLFNRDKPRPEAASATVFFGRNNISPGWLSRMPAISLISPAIWRPAGHECANDSEALDHGSFIAQNGHRETEDDSGRKLHFGQKRAATKLSECRWHQRRFSYGSCLGLADHL
jgi:hypothetical protein